MAYKVHLIVETITDVAFTFYIQNYTENLVYIDDHEIIAKRQTTAADSDGYIYTLGGAYWYIHKYDESGNLILRSGGGKYRRATAIRVVETISVLRHAYSGGYRYVREYSTENFASISFIYLTRYKDYQGLVFEDANIFYTINRTDKKIEKWNYGTGTKLAEKDLVDVNATGYTIGLAGDNLLLMGKDPDLGLWNHLLITPKDFSGALTKIEILNEVGEEDAQGVRTGDIERDYFLVTFTRAVDSVPPSQNSFLRKYSNAGSLLAEVQVHNPDGALGIYSIPVTYGIGAVAAAVTTEAVSELGIDHAKGNGTAIGGSITERGFEVRLAFSGTLYEYISHSIAGFTGDVSLVGTVWEGTLVKTVTETGTFEAGAFAGDLGRFPIAVSSNKLFEAETYDYRAYAIIDEVAYYGEYIEFTTNSYPAGQYPDDQLPITDIIPTEPPVEPVVPIIPPPFIPWPPFPPEPPLPDGTWLGMFYYRKAYTKKDLDDLRRKCRAFQDNMVEYALVLNHNVNVMQQFLNDMTDYTGSDEYNTFKRIIPTQHLNALARRPLKLNDFKAIINEFISNCIDNTNNVNNNFALIKNGLAGYTYTDEGEFKDIVIRTKLVDDENPDVERLKKVVDALNIETINNFAIINHNLEIVRAILI